MPRTSGQTALHPGCIVVKKRQPMVKREVVLVHKSRNGFLRRGQTTAHVGTQPTKGLGRQDVLPFCGAARLIHRCRRGVGLNNVPRVVIWALSDPIREGGNKCLKISKGPYRRLRGETQLTSMANPLCPLMRTVPAFSSINTETAGGVSST